MLLIFHATGNFSHAKARHMYLFEIGDLEKTMNSIEFAKFTSDGFLTFRRTDKYIILLQNFNHLIKQRNT